MKQTIKNFLVLSAFCFGAVSMANAANTVHTNKKAEAATYEMPINLKLKVPKFEYQGERYDFETWISVKPRNLPVWIFTKQLR